MRQPQVQVGDAARAGGDDNAHGRRDGGADDREGAVRLDGIDRWITYQPDEPEDRGETREEYEERMGSTMRLPLTPLVEHDEEPDISFLHNAANRS
jgi:hypothetical protein